MEQVAATDTRVLVLGETGVGKGLLAQTIHTKSPRHKHAFIAVNCGALPAGLIESELFGHEKGAFTGAVARRSGLFVGYECAEAALSDAQVWDTTAQAVVDAALWR